MRAARYRSGDVKERCSRKLGIDFRAGGSGRSPHDTGWYRLEGKKTARITVARGRKPIPPKTYRSMAGQLKLTVEEFDDLLDCPMGGAEYERIIRGRVGRDGRRTP